MSKFGEKEKLQTADVRLEGESDSTGKKRRRRKGFAMNLGVNDTGKRRQPNKRKRNGQEG